MKIQKQASKFIKPSTPTPPNRRHYKIGFIDELAPFVDVSIVLFFSKNSNHNKDVVLQLEKSLEKTLKLLYPLAGRYVEESHTIDCNDEGAKFLQAKVNINLEEILRPEVNVMSIDEFIPNEIIKTQNIVLAIQLTTFKCGGIALGVSAMHKVVDASTLSTFLNQWADVNREENEMKLTGSSFTSSSLFPARGVPSIPLPLDYTLNMYTRMKLSFSESVISNMKIKATASEKLDTRHLSKVQLVSAVIWKALIGVDRVTHVHPRESILSQPINLREKMASTIPIYSCGNMWGVCATKSIYLETTEELTSLLNNSVRKAIDDYSKVSHDSEQGQNLVLNSFINMGNIPESTNVIPLSSWCKFPFYEAEFGFGKPIWVVPGTVPVKNSAHLIDGMGGNGVEAYIFLETKDVRHFEEALDVKDLCA